MTRKSYTFMVYIGNPIIKFPRVPPERIADAICHWATKYPLERVLFFNLMKPTTAILERAQEVAKSLSARIVFTLLKWWGVFSDPVEATKTFFSYILDEIDRNHIAGYRTFLEMTDSDLDPTKLLYNTKYLTFCTPPPVVVGYEEYLEKSSVYHEYTLPLHQLVEQWKSIFS